MEEKKIDFAVRVKTSILAIASLVFGILGFCLCISKIPAILAIVFGIIALTKIGKSAGTLKGKGLALAGIVLGGLWFILAICILGIGTIAISTFLSSKISAVDKKIPVNEALATAGLKMLVNTEVMWRDMDADQNDEEDYWTYDVSCLYRMYRPDEIVKVKLINVSLAKADNAPARDNVFGPEKIDPWQEMVPRPVPKSGYLYQSLKYDEEENPYNLNLVGVVSATNNAKFGFIAVPAKYGTTGKRIFIVNQDEIIYATDPGSDEDKWIDQWPGADPSTVLGPGGKHWQVVE